MEKVKIAILGLGRAGHGMQCKDLENFTDKFELVAVCDIIEERADKVSEIYGAKAYYNIDDLLKDESAEIVSIATRSCDHFSHAVKVLKAGKNVLIEKPMSCSYSEAQTLRDMDADPNFPNVYVRHNRRFEDSFIKVKELVESGKIGEVFEINMCRNSFGQRDDWQTIKEFGGGQLLNWGPHLIDHSLQLLGSPAKSVVGDLKHTVAGGDCEDHLSITFVGENDRTIRMQISGGAALPSPMYRVYGTRGAAEIVNDEMFTKYIDPEQEVVRPESDPGTPQGFFGDSGTFQAKAPLRWMEDRVAIAGDEVLLVMWEHLYNALKKGIAYPITTEQAIAVVEVVDMVKKGTKFE